MNKNKFILLVIGMLCMLSSYAQEEFFGNNSGLSISGATSDFSKIYGGGLSLHLKNGLVFSYSSVFSLDYIPTIVSVGYLIDLNKHSTESKLNAFISLSDITTLSYLFQDVGYISPAIGIIYTSFNKINYPTSLGISASLYFYRYNFDQIDQSYFNLYFAQAFFARSTVYPVIGMAYSLPLKQPNGYTQGEGSFEFHAGLNIRLSKPERKRKLNLPEIF
jgi:hypothetical protein